MAYKTVGELKVSLAGILSGTDLDDVQDTNGALERAARELVQQVDVPEASNVEVITLYADVIDNEVPSTIFGTSIFDIRPQGVDRPISDSVSKRIGVFFDRMKREVMSGYMVSFEYRNTMPIMRIAQTVAKSAAPIDTMDATTGWIAAGSASGLTLDETVFYKSPASLRFTLTGSSAGTLTKAVTSQDLSDYEDVGVAFLALRVPSGTDLTSIQLKLGSSSGNYNSVTATEGFLGAWQDGDWLLVAFDFSGASQTGTPDWSAIDYAQITLNHTATEVNVRVGGLFISLPSPHEIVFQTAAIFLNEDGTLSNVIDSDNAQIVLNDSAYTLYQHQSALEIAAQNENYSKVADERNTLHNPSVGLYPLYRVDNPAQKLKTVGTYYSGIRPIRKR